MITTRETNQLLKVEVLTHYSNGKLVCVKCGEDRLNCLTLDHVSNDGCIDKISRSGNALYRKLKSTGYPSGYQTLCMNCNMEKALLLKMSTPGKMILTLRVPKGLYEEIEKRASNNGQNISDYTRTALEYYVEYIEQNKKEAK